MNSQETANILIAVLAVIAIGIAAIILAALMIGGIVIYMKHLR